MHMPHLVCPSVDEHGSSFHLLPIVNTAAINKGLRVPFSFLLPIILGIYSEMGLLHNMGVLFPTFE